jgi:hypothetical protein
LHIFDRFNIKASLFIDSGYLIKLDEFRKKYDVLEENYQQIITQIKNLSNDEHSIPAAPGVWSRVPHCWWMRCLPSSQYVCVLSVPYPLRFLFASRSAMMGRVLGIVYRCIATHLIKKAEFSRKTARTDAVTLIQRFGSALNLNAHFHMLFIDGVYIEHPDGSLRFRWVKAPTSAELSRLTQVLAHRIGR